MGLLDSLFGGGTKLELKLDTTTIPEGGTVSGSISLSGGKKPLKLTALKVRLVFLKVTPVEGQTLPKIELQNLFDNTVVSNQDLPPASLNKFEFAYPVPTGTDPKGTYKVYATADIPSVKDPSAEVEIKIIGAPTGESRGLFGLFKGVPTKEDVLGLFPKLMSRDEDELCEGLSDLQCAAYDPEKNFVGVQSLLDEKMRTGNDRVRTAALAAWGTVLNNRAKPEHIKSLEALAVAPGLSEDLMREVVTAAAKFAEEGAFPLVQRLAKHPDPAVRAELATRLYLDAERDLKGKKELLLSMVDDPEALVRKAVFGAFAGFNDDKAVMELAAKRIATDASPDVQRACLSALALAHHHGMKELVFTTFVAQLKNPRSEVRKELSESLHWLPEDPRLTEIVLGLLKDGDIEVRRSMAWQACNMGDHTELKDVFLKALTDPDEEVRGNVLGALERLMPFPEAAKILRERMKSDPNEKTFWGAFNCAKFTDDPEGKKIMRELTSAPFTRIAQRAREELA